MSGRCFTVTLPDGTRAIVRTAKRGVKPTEADLQAIVELKAALVKREAGDANTAWDEDEEAGVQDLEERLERALDHAFPSFVRQKP